MKNRKISIEEAKRLAAGPFGNEIAKFPMLFAKPIFFVNPPQKTVEMKMNNGTVSLINLGHGPIGITCFHVLDYFKKRVKKDSKTLFQVGNLKFNPVPQIISENERLDLVTISFTEKQAENITNDGEIGSCFFKPHLWPPAKIKKGDFIAFGGFPAVWRQQLSAKEFRFDTFSSGASPISAVGDDYFVCQFERENWEKPFDPYRKEELHDLGGLSGGPVFILRKLCWEFVGIVCEFSSGYDLMYIRPSKFIKSDGSISPPS